MIKKIVPQLVLIFSFFIFSTANDAYAWWAKEFGATSSSSGNIWPADDGSYYLWLTSGTTANKKLHISQISSSGAIQWTKTIDGPGDDDLKISQLEDGGFFVSGRTKSFGAGGTDFLWAKFDSAWNPVYQKVFGGTGDESADFTQAADGGFIAVGSTNSFSTDSNDLDILIVKISSSGEVQWSKAIHHGLRDSQTGILEVDNGYILTASVENRTDPNNIGRDILLAKLDSSGTIAWEKLYSGSVESGSWINYVTAHEVTGGYLLWGTTKDSVYSDITDILLIQMDTSGNILWQKQYSSEVSGLVNTVIENPDGTFLLEGTVSDYNNPPDTANILLMKLSSSGNIIWQKTLGGQGYDAASLTKNSDGGYLLSGSTTSFGSAANDYDILYGKLDSDLNLLWQKTFGSDTYGESGRVVEKSNQFYITGARYSLITYKTDVFGVFYLDSSGNVPGCPYITDISLTESPVNLTEGNPSLTTSTPTLVERPFGTATDVSLTIGTDTLTASIICGQETPCSAWADVISKYQAYVSGQATWADVITCYQQYVSH